MEQITPFSIKPGGHIAPFFVLNSELQEDRLREMVRDCAAAGFDAIILHARPGLRTPYLSKAWFDSIETCIIEARELGLKTWLYDEFPWPSGAAGGRVIQRNADFAEKHLSIKRYSLEGGGRVVQVLGSRPVIEAFIVPLADGKPVWSGARTVTESVGMRNTTWVSREWDSRYYYLEKYVRRYECWRAMDYLPEQVFEDVLPTGPWELIAYSLETGSGFVEPFGHYVDLSTREATDAFLEETHERYRARFGHWFGSEILGIFTDEPKYRNALPWSRTIARSWTSYQRDPRALLALLPDSDAFELRKSYRDQITECFSKNWIAPIRDWCRKSKLGLIGHISPEEDWHAESLYAGSILRNLREFAVPGCDLIIPAVGDAEHAVLNFTPSMAVSAAAQAGASHAICEVFACSNYSLDMQTMKRLGDWLLFFGINFLVPHGCFYSLAGPRRFDAPPTLLPPSTLHPFLAEWSRSIRETAETLGPLRQVDWAVVRPMSHLFGLSENQHPESVRLFEEAMEVIEHLLEQGIAFHWVDDFDIEEAEIGVGNLKVGCADYRQLIVWEGLLPAKDLKHLQAHGICCLSPTEALALAGPLECSEGDVRATRDTQGRWFCINLSPALRRFRIAGMEVFLEGYESRLIDSPRPQPSREFSKQLGGNWEIQPPAENTFRLTTWTCNGVAHPMGSAYCTLVSKPSSVATVYGPVPQTLELAAAKKLVYKTTVHWDGPPTALSLCLEEGAVVGAAEIFFDGIELTAWKPRSDFLGGRECDLAPLLRQGAIPLRIEITAMDARDSLWLGPVLRGDFLVAGEGEMRRRSEGELLRGGDWSRIGYPHFSGSMTFTNTFHWEASQSSEDSWLVFARPPAGTGIEVVLNEHSLGTLQWAPWRVSVEKALRAGPNRLCLRVTNTLQNFLYGEARASGPLDSVEIHVIPDPPGSAACDKDRQHERARQERLA